MFLMTECHPRRRWAWHAGLLLLASVSAADAQVRYQVDPKATLAWYQANPHTSLVWGTTCPADPFWRAGESRNDPGGTRGLPLPKVGMAMVKDSIIPLWQRPRASRVCQQSVRGEFIAQDTVNWKGITGTIIIRPDSFYSGLMSRDRLARSDVFGLPVYPEIKFVVDSLTDVVTTDSTRGFAWGTFFFRNVQLPEKAPVRIIRDPLGLRVIARVSMIPTDLVEVYGVSIHNIRLGMSSGTWQAIHFGVDAILNRVSP
jgi:hypothetical protein